jgi:hypothetical protein
VSYDTPLREIVRAQVVFLFGKFRPVKGLSEEEIKGIAAERTEFGTQLLDLLRPIAMRSTEREVAQHLRAVTREFVAEPMSQRAPDPQAVAGRVAQRIGKRRGPKPCLACEELKSAPGVWLTSERRPRQEGEAGFEIRPDEWLCATHGPILVWYTERNRWWEAGRLFTSYPAPSALIPGELYGQQNVAATVEFTDGDRMGMDAVWAREYAAKVLRRPLMLNVLEAAPTQQDLPL